MDGFDALAGFQDRIDSLRGFVSEAHHAFDSGPPPPQYGGDLYETVVLPTTEPDQQGSGEPDDREGERGGDGGEEDPDAVLTAMMAPNVSNNAAAFDTTVPVEDMFVEYLAVYQKMAILFWKVSTCISLIGGPAAEEYPLLMQLNNAWAPRFRQLPSTVELPTPLNLGGVWGRTAEWADSRDFVTTYITMALLDLEISFSVFANFQCNQTRKDTETNSAVAMALGLPLEFDALGMVRAFEYDPVRPFELIRLTGIFAEMTSDLKNDTQPDTTIERVLFTRVRKLPPAILFRERKPGVVPRTLDIDITDKLSGRKRRYEVAERAVRSDIDGEAFRQSRLFGRSVQEIDEQKAEIARVAEETGEKFCKKPIASHATNDINWHFPQYQVSRFRNLLLGAQNILRYYMNTRNPSVRECFFGDGIHTILDLVAKDFPDFYKMWKSEAEIDDHFGVKEGEYVSRKIRVSRRNVHNLPHFQVLADPAPIDPSSERSLAFARTKAKKEIKWSSGPDRITGENAMRVCYIADDSANSLDFLSNIFEFLLDEAALACDDPAAATTRLEPPRSLHQSGRVYEIVRRMVEEIPAFFNICAGASLDNPEVALDKSAILCWELYADVGNRNGPLIKSPAAQAFLRSCICGLPMTPGKETAETFSLTKHSPGQLRMWWMAIFGVLVRAPNAAERFWSGNAVKPFVRAAFERFDVFADFFATAMSEVCATIISPAAIVASESIYRDRAAVYAQLGELWGIQEHYHCQAIWFIDNPSDFMPGHGRWGTNHRPLGHLQSDKPPSDYLIQSSIIDFIANTTEPKCMSKTQESLARKTARAKPSRKKQKLQKD